VQICNGREDRRFQVRNVPVGDDIAVERVITRLRMHVVVPDKHRKMKEFRNAEK